MVEVILDGIVEAADGLREILEGAKFINFPDVQAMQIESQNRVSTFVATAIFVCYIFRYNRSYGMNTVIRKIGNSEGVIIPKEMLESLGLKAGDEVSIAKNSQGIQLIPSGDNLARQLDAARECMDKYRVALRELAK